MPHLFSMDPTDTFLSTVRVTTAHNMSFFWTAKPAADVHIVLLATASWVPKQLI